MGGLDAVAYVAYTSGSTGRPKGAAIPQRGVLRLVEGSFLDAPGDVPTGILPDDVFLQLAPVAFDASTLEIWGPLLHGARLALAPPGPLSLDALAAVLERHRVSVLWLTAGLFHQMVDHRPDALGRLRRLLAGGDVLSPERCRRLLDARTASRDFRLVDGYGPTENTTFTCCHVLAPGDDPGAAVPVGRPIAGTEIFVFDADGRPVPPGVEGELYTGGDGLARGYLGRPSATAQAFVPHPFSDTPGARLYRTGDRVRFRPDGTLDFLGRLDFQVKVRGFRVEPGELAAALEGCAGVRRAAVVARPVESAGGKEVRLDAYVVLDPAAAAETPGVEGPAAADEHVETWRQLYDDRYATAEGPLDFEIVGWNSSYDGAPLPAAEMAEWVDATVARIAAWQPRRVLEIGCGTGLLLARLAPDAERYVGADFSPVVLAHVARLVAARGLGAVELVEATADRVAERFAPRSFDTVIVNSVSQYFPSADYLLAMIDGALELLADGGRLFVGDVRNLARLPAFHASLLLHRAAPDENAGGLLAGIERALAAERELLIDPELFRALPGRSPRVAGVLTQPKRGAAHNELSRFRYDATVVVGTAGERTEVEVAELAAASLVALRRRLEAEERRPFAVAGLRDARVARERAFEAGVEGWRRRPRMPVADLRAELDRPDDAGVDPEALARLAEHLGWSCQLRLDPRDALAFGAVFWPAELPGAEQAARHAAFERAAGVRDAAALRWADWVHQPMSAAAAEALVARVRHALAAALPSYLLPGTLTVLGRLPLNANGKVDARALPEPSTPEDSEEAASRPPATEAERRLATIWRDLLRPGGALPGVDQDFFELGGHSLLATRMVARVRDELGVELPLRRVFETPTIEGLAAALAIDPPSMPTPSTPAASTATEGPLALAQRRIWVLHRLEGGAAYHVPIAARLDGALDVAALEKSLALIVERHAAMRTAFFERAGEVEGEPVQRIVDVAFRLEIEALDDPESLEATLHRDAARPFDLARPPLLRARLLALGPESHVLACVFHHLVFDGWSLGLFLDELTASYDAFSRHRAPQLPALPWRYLDHALWQRDVLESRLPEQLATWRRRLDGAPRVLELPTDLPRPARQGFRGRGVPIGLAAPVARRLEALAQQEGASLFMALTALFGLLLGLRAGSRDLLIGAPVAGRTRREVEPLIGLFVNTLVLRVQLGGDPTFRGLLAAVRAMALEAFENQDLPFERLVEALRPERDLSRNPLVQVLLTLHNNPLGDAKLGDVAIAPLELDGRTVKVDLDLAFRPVPTPAGDALAGQLRYDQDLFADATARRLVEHFELLAATVLADPDVRLAALPRATAAERALIAAAHTPLAHVPILSVDRWIARRRAALPAGGGPIEDGGSRLTWNELDARADAVAAGLQRRGISRGDRVAVLVERSATLPALLLGIWRAGAAWVPLDPIFPAERREQVCADAAPVLIVADGVAPPPAAYQIVDPDDLLAADPSGAALPEVGAADLAYVLFTSGSTGRPKGVAVPHGAVVAFLEAFAERPGLSAADTLLAITTLSFDIAVLELFLPLAIGARLMIADRGEVADAERLARRIEASGATVLQATPTTWRLLAGVGWRNAGGARVICGGEALPPDLASWLLEVSPEVWNVYGPTEATVWATAARLEKGSFPAGGPPVGQPIPGTRAEIVDGDGAPLGVGVDGELLLGGAGLAWGYWGRPSLTAERFVPDPAGDGGRLYRTGDLARWRENGQLAILGRRDHQVKVRGFRIELGEIEAALEDLPAIRHAAVLVEGEAGDQRLTAFVVAAGETPADDAVLAALRRRLPAYMVPAALRWLPALPTTANGKVDRRALAGLEGIAARSSDVVPPATQREAELLGLWREVLGASGPALGVEHDFFASGGHSLSAIRLVSAIEAKLGQRVALATLFEAATPRALARHLERGAPAGGALLPLARGAGAPLFCVPGVAGNPVYLRPLAERLGRPTWGLEAAGVDGREAPLSTVEDMARRHLEALRRLHPTAPLLLGGHSFGAKIAFETARQALEAGLPVAGLAIFDTPAPTPANGPLGVGWDAFDWLAEAAAQIAAWGGGTLALDAAELRALGDAAYDHVVELLGEAWIEGVGGEQRLRGMVDVCLASQRHAYTPAAQLNVPIHLFVAAQRPRLVIPTDPSDVGADPCVRPSHPEGRHGGLPLHQKESRDGEMDALKTLLAEPDLGWGAFTSAGVTVVHVDGDHVSMFAEPAVDGLAARLRSVFAGL